MNKKPKNLDDCITILKENLSKEIVEGLKNGTIAPISLHHTLGQYLRNTWGLWGKSDLKKWFEKNGIWHPDDMSGIILDSFTASLKEEPIKFKEQTKYYKDYWKKMKKVMNNKSGSCTANFKCKNGKWEIV